MTARPVRTVLAGLAALSLGAGLAGGTPAAAAVPGSPVGVLDALAFFPDGSPVVYGWALDPDVIGSTIGVDVYVDGLRGYPGSTGSFDRPDVLAATGAPSAGFVAVLPPQGPGRHTVCAYAINAGPGENTSIGCRPYGPTPRPPVGTLDPLAFFPDGSPVVYGWALDPDTIASAMEVDVYVDGVRGYPGLTGTFDRPDVLAATGAPLAGFVAVLPPQGPGRHTVCAYGIDSTRQAANTLLGCRPYGDAPAPPPPAPKSYPNCVALNVDYPHGVGRPGARDSTSTGNPVTDFAVDGPTYSVNTARDADGDGIACERH